MSILYTIFISPLQLIFEFIFVIANEILKNPGLSIIALSLAMNFLVLPLYKRADEIQNEQRLVEQKIRPMADHIKKSFKGDERFMMLQTYYRQNNYSQFGILKSSVSLLLQIPFFIAAYQMLSNLEALQGIPFGFINDLGAPDQLIKFGNVAINVLPIAMTVINIISGIIYTKGMPKQSKIQLFGMAAIFLVLLYNSPSGLVFYWTLNNVFSLCKNVFYKLKNPQLILSIMASISGAIILAFGVFSIHRVSMRIVMVLAVVGIALQLPIIIYLVSKKHKIMQNCVVQKGEKIGFFTCALFLAILTGALIPSSAIVASPQEFVDLITLNNPLTHIANSFALAIGLFVVWIGVYYLLANDKGKRVMGLLMWIVTGAGLMDYMLFGKNYGTITPKLAFLSTISPTMKEQFINLFAVCVLAIVLFLIWKFKSNFVKGIAGVLCITVCCMTGINIYNIEKVVKDSVSFIEDAPSDQMKLPLSKNGNNVVVLMMDRAVGAYLPYILQEKPELKQRLSGFTYYPNTISYGTHTNFASPGIYGGYDYVPEEINKRSDVLLKDKQNEALKIMPTLFAQNGYSVTVSDPTYANYSLVPDLSIYDDLKQNYNDFSVFTMMGKIDCDYGQEKTDGDNKLLDRNFFCYGLFRISPTILQPFIYFHGSYNDPNGLYSNSDELPSMNVANSQIVESKTKASKLSYGFLRSYYCVKNYSNLTIIEDTDKPSFIMMSNELTHEEQLLQTPNYVPQMKVDNTEYYEAHKGDYVIDGKELRMDTDFRVSNYCSNMVAIIELCNWFDYMRENGVYDNTKIIIVADHGVLNDQYEGLPNYKGCVRLGHNPLLIVKDFNAKNPEIITDNQFMTNADVPTIAFNGVVQNPINPYTHNPINNKAKNGDQHIILSNDYNTDVNNGTQFLDSEWMSVRDNIFDDKNWSTYESKY